LRDSIEELEARGGIEPPIMVRALSLQRLLPHSIVPNRCFGYFGLSRERNLQRILQRKRAEIFFEIILDSEQHVVYV
jgi:hypothetical protein